MKIHNFGTPGMNPYKQTFAKQESILKQQPTGSDKIEISHTAKELQQQSTFVTDRQKKIEAIQTQIENGTYKVDAEKVAKSLVDFFGEHKN
ncbi:MAG TPA: flagellar biosynthesis anti-sigma factor FlgM [Bacillus sp. (in: firmicutes)]|uniref:flagellar biosynthesis anti-sigma factor FlgM n=1 Tax=Bacillus litorisediminis TaxID=2922713 RepID=UPI001FAC5D55|nr:flagellar biosynthesis anti-sigma factor FlgM [Bacillus litorisediminis]HWO77297.1 flagellar biosynthesis anti-sigma factor FlgM [Bacillus sp. (in: firmicutes)]